MCAGVLSGISVFVLITLWVPFAERHLTSAALPANPKIVAQQQTGDTGAPPVSKGVVQQPAVQPQESEPDPQDTPPFKDLRSSKEGAWKILKAACNGEKTNDRATAIRVLGLVPNNAKVLGVLERALRDEKPAVRSAAAAALGESKSRAAIPVLREALRDKEPAVSLAAAHSLELMHDRSAYKVYYEVLTGQRKTGKGAIASETSALKDPKKIAQLGFEEGIGFVPFAGIGWQAIKVMKKDDTSPLRAAAAKVLARDPDPASTKALTDAAVDESWLVRAAALEALAKRGDPSALDTVELCMADEKAAVKYTAAAAVLRLTSITKRKKEK